ncbi:MAG: WD40 repeat domain-containing protein [Phycisphaeraceae bacterium]
MLTKPGRLTAAPLLCFILTGCSTPLFTPSTWEPPQSQELTAQQSDPSVTPLDWRDWPVMPEPVVGHRVSPGPEYLTVTGGITGLGQMTPDIQRFNGSAWTISEVQLITPRAFHAQVRLNDTRVFVAGGQTGSAMEPQATDTTEIVNFSLANSIPGPTLPEPMASPTIHLLSDGRVIIIGRTTISIFDPRDASAIRSSPLAAERRNHASALLPDDRIVIVAGRCNTIEVFDPATMTSSLLTAQLPAQLDDHQIITLPDGRVWVLGGQETQTGETTDQTWLLSLKPSEALIQGPHLDYSTGVADACLVRSGNTAWLIGGESQRARKDVELSLVRQLDLKKVSVAQQAATRFDHDDAAATLWRGRLVVLSGLSYTQLLGRRLPYPNGQVEYAVVDR